MEKRVIKKGRNFLRIGMMLVLSFLPIKNELKSDTKEVILKVPVLKINAYMMGMEDLDQDVYSNLQNNIDYLNQEFEGKVGFELNNLHIDFNGAYLPDLYKNFYKGEGELVNEVVEPIEQEGAVNVFIFHTYCNEGTDLSLIHI